MTGRAEFPLWGGEATVLVADGTRAEAARAAVGTVVEAVDAALSVHREDSVAAWVNRAEGREVRTGELFRWALEIALRAWRASGGLVDVAGGSLDWREAVIEDPLRLPAGARLDFGSVGKAWAADLAAERAAEAAGCGVLVALAGDLAVAGEIPAEGWTVRVCDDHRTAGGLPDGQDVRLTAAGGLATSSLRVRGHRSLDGTVVNHIVDPRSGLPVRGEWRTVTVSAGSCVDANIATTETLVLGHDRRLAGRGLPARLVHADGWTRTLNGWPEREAA
ncbi:FAD:protein FMN transferase [Actinocorallia longicatena]|uniref:FAD:protein FMN transferase n=1 Tax=Actinocorallia longicatena TaxID=111803 RepID=A0ABP6Q8E1_9ACTN